MEWNWNWLPAFFKISSKISRYLLVFWWDILLNSLADFSMPSDTKKIANSYAHLKRYLANFKSILQIFFQNKQKIYKLNSHIVCGPSYEDTS